MVNESLETNVPGIFACGNVLHVHDLVDYVSEEATNAGRNAAAFVRRDGKDDAALPAVEIVPGDGIGYTVPETVRPKIMNDLLTVRFRVRGVYRDHFISVYFDGERVQHRKKQIVAPGEMEQVILQKKDLAAHKDLKKITICLEEA